MISAGSLRRRLATPAPPRPAAPTPPASPPPAPPPRRPSRARRHRRLQPKLLQRPHRPGHHAAAARRRWPAGAAPAPPRRPGSNASRQALDRACLGAAITVHRQHRLERIARVERAEPAVAALHHLLPGDSGNSVGPRSKPCGAAKQEKIFPSRCCQQATTEVLTGCNVGRAPGRAGPPPARTPARVRSCCGHPMRRRRVFRRDRQPGAGLRRRLLVHAGAGRGRPQRNHRPGRRPVRTKAWHPPALAS